MKGTFEFDPARCDCGAATASVRQILTERAAIDWFVPPRDPAAESVAARLVEQHNACARTHLPEVFPAHVETRSSRGGWDDFAALCSRVRGQSWDWKFSALKKLSFSHSTSRGWTLRDQAQRCMSIESGAIPRPGDLFVRVGDQVFWNALSPRLELEALLPRDRVEPARWYLSYADIDIMECIEWQLAEGGDDLEGNPFVPLMRCYAAGFYPFSLGPATLVLFAFDR
ncbi:hypothetical protein [Sorangium sp. So ce1182]|uniref:hypothetical protein n=1 Tax=Sorangium sp. So ce1182 TaxID=3133334 RepID=UPI003F5E8452